jgi:hypothetical protein
MNFQNQMEISYTLDGKRQPSQYEAGWMEYANKKIWHSKP